MSHTIFCLLIRLVLSHKPLRMGVQPKYKQFNKTLLFFDCWSNWRYKDEDFTTEVKFIRSLPVLHVETSSAMSFFSDSLYLQKDYQIHDLRF